MGWDSRRAVEAEKGPEIMGELDPRIRIRAPLRCDGIGRLDCAEDTVSGDRVAVRWLPLEANGDAAVKACEKLPSHHALPRILQTGQVGASAFVALDFPDGEMLSARGEERLDHELLLKLAAQLSDALATVHAQGVVHGEMSRDSVLLVPGGKASLWDMPLVIANRLSDRRGENRLMQNLVKTAPYLSPERARGEGASQEGDVYALGVILCVSAGAPLPTAPTTLGVVHKVAAGQWVPRVPASLPQRCATMLSQMISADPSARPTAAQVAAAFAEVPPQHALATVPELQAVRLPPEILAAADALMKQQLDAMRAPTREMSLAQVEAATQAMKPALSGAEGPALSGAEGPALSGAPSGAEGLAQLPISNDPLPELALAPVQSGVEGAAAITVQANTLDQVSEPARDVVRIPTQEIEAVGAIAVPAQVKPAVVVTPSVALNDSLSVSPELLADGAMSLSAEEVEAIHANTRQVWMVFGGVVGAALALIGVVVMLATATPEPVVVAHPTPKTVKPVKAPVAPRVELDELTPLTRVAPKAAPAPAKSPRAARVESAPVEAAPEPVTVPSVLEQAPERSANAADFSFLEGAEAPRSELKRPSTEL